MNYSRRDFLKAAAAVAAAMGGPLGGVGPVGKALARETEDGGLPVVWIEAQSCTGCSVSLLNSMTFGAIEDVLLDVLDVNFHGALMAAAGRTSVAAAERAYRRGGYALCVEGSIPSAADGKYCYVWPGVTATKAIERYARRASVIMGVGACACFGGMPGGTPNPTGAKGLADSYFGKRVIRIPGCPTHPDWVVGTIAHIIANGEVPPLDMYGRPLTFFADTVHEKCAYYPGGDNEASTLGEKGCLAGLGCKGPFTRSDCPNRRWNVATPGEPGVNWCIGAGTPCFGCTEPFFPDGMSPFYYLEPEEAD